MSGSFVCIQCGSTFEYRAALEGHWEADGHGPAQIQQKQIEKARESIRPVHSATVQRRRRK